MYFLFSERWLNLVFAALSLVTLGFTLFATNHFIREHVWNHIIKHHFCATCGTHPLGEGTDAKGNHMVAINIRCLEDVDLATVPVQQFDGRAL